METPRKAQIPLDKLDAFLALCQRTLAQVLAQDALERVEVGATRVAGFLGGVEMDS